LVAAVADVSRSALEARCGDLTVLSNLIGDAPAAAEHRQPAARWRWAAAYLSFVACSVGTTVALIWAPDDLQLVLAAVLAATWVFGIFALLLYLRDGPDLIFHAGFFAASSALVYITLPAVFFALSGSEWSDTSDPRLVLMHTNADDVAYYVWRGTLYLAAFCATYVVVIWTVKRPSSRLVIPVTATDVGICAVIVLACFCYQTIISFAFDVSLSQANTEFPTDGVNRNLPLFIAQITYNIMAVQRIAKLALVVALVGLWKHKWAKLALVVFMASEVFATVALFGPRSYLAFLVLAALLSFHKLVRPVSVPVIAAGGILLLALLLAYGYARDYSDNPSDFSTANEFQVLMGTALHLRDMVANGLKVPPQVLWSELLMLIPQQLLPTDKIDPSLWYLLESGYSETGSGYMFGVQAQAETGWGGTELFVRGTALALVLGFLHREFIRRSPSFLLMVSYVWLLTAIYYSYRAATFYWVTFVVFRLLVFIGLFLVMRRLLSIWRAEPETVPPSAGKT
jgi:hypothetical protein